jgi:hypothetical protein
VTADDARDIAIGRAIAACVLAGLPPSLRELGLAATAAPGIAILDAEGLARPELVARRVTGVTPRRFL